VPAEAPVLSQCCLARSTCRHWREFNRRYLLAVLRGNLNIAIDELMAKFESTGRMLTRDGEAYRLTAETLTSALTFAVSFGAIAPPGIDPELIEKAITRMVDNTPLKEPADARN
jgi:hypothetical protein